jgi:hypothetical protein
MTKQEAERYVKVIEMEMEGDVAKYQRARPDLMHLSVIVSLMQGIRDGLFPEEKPKKVAKKKGGRKSKASS